MLKRDTKKGIGSRWAVRRASEGVQEQRDAYSASTAHRRGRDRREEREPLISSSGSARKVWKTAHETAM